MSSPTSGITGSPAIEQTSKEWFAREVQPHDLQLKSYLRNSFPGVHDVDDVVQESYIRIWKARTTSPILSAKAFLFTIAKRLALDCVRRRNRSPFITIPDLASLDVPGEEAGSAERAALNEEIALLGEALAALQPRCREIILLRKFQNLSGQEVADRLGITVGTVEEQVYRGIRKMEQFFIKHGVSRSWHHE